MSNQKQNRVRIVAPTRKTLACLAAPAAWSDQGVTVDEVAGVIHNVALCTVGPAKGHGFDIDQVTIEQLVGLAGALQPEGVKSRFSHPKVTDAVDPTTGNAVQKVGDDTGTMVGRIRNVRNEGQQARGDVFLGDYARNVPGLGDVRGYLLAFAANDPAGIGMSPVFNYYVEPQLDALGGVTGRPARLRSLEAIDFVGQPASNPKGLLSAQCFSPQPPDGGDGTPHAAGWSDANPRDMAQAPLPISTPDDLPPVMRQYLAAIAKGGPLTLGGLACRFSGRLEQMRANAEWLCAAGYCQATPKGYAATARGVALAALRWG